MPDIIDVIGKIRGTGLDFPIFPDVVPIDFNSDCWKYKLMSKAIQHTKDGQDMVIESWRVNLYTKANYTATIDQPYESAYGSTHVFIGQDVAGINGRVAELTDDEFEARITGIKEFYEEFTDDNVFEFDVLINNKEMALVLFSDAEAWTGSRYNGDKVYVKTFHVTADDLFSDGGVSLAYETDILNTDLKEILTVNRVSVGQTTNVRFTFAYTNLVFTGLTTPTTLNVYYTKN